MWPWCPPQRTQWYSVRSMKSLRSVVVANTPGIVVKKLGHPVPLSNFIAEVNSGSPLAATSSPSASRVFQFFCRSSTFTAPFAGFCPHPAAPKPARDSAVKPLNQLRRSIFFTSESPQYRPPFPAGIPAGVYPSRKDRASLTMSHHERSRSLARRGRAHALRSRGRCARAARCSRALAAGGAGDDRIAVRREAGPRRLGDGDPQPRLLEHRARGADRGRPGSNHPGVFHGARLLDEYGRGLRGGRNARARRQGARPRRGRGEHEPRADRAFAEFLRLAEAPLAGAFDVAAS